MILSLAATQMKMTPAEGVTGATINAAYSLKRGDKIERDSMIVTQGKTRTVDPALFNDVAATFFG